MLRRTAGLLLLAAGLAFAAASAPADEDHRAWQHGVNLLRVGERLLLIWGSPGNPPRPNPGGDWQHDIYYAWVDNPPAAGEVAVAPQVLVSRPEAQEPPSAAINSRGTILVTAEDGNGGINQQAGLWDSSLAVMRRYPFTVRRGGHSGHAAALGERFLAVYGEGWVDGGGWRGLGTGESVYARVVEGDGRLGRELRLTPQGQSDPRDGWPLVAASDRNWLALWQRYPGQTLQSALVSDRGQVLARRELMAGMPLRYTYDVGYAPALSSYVVSGTSDGAGFISLISRAGEVVVTAKGLPPMVAESRLVVGAQGAQVLGVYPVSPHGVAVVRLSAGAVQLVKVIDHPYVWDYAGTTGVFVAPDRVLFASVSTSGVHVFTVELKD